MLAALFVGALVTMAAETSVPAPVKGNPKTKVYHKPSCRYYNAKGTTVEFKSEAEAQAAKYKPCKKCCGVKKAKVEKQQPSKKAETPVKKVEATPKTPTK